MRTRRSARREESALRSGLVFLAAVGGTGLALLGGFGLMVSAASHAVSDASSANDYDFLPEDNSPARAIPIPPAACPYLRLVSAAAAAATEPGPRADESPAKWDPYAAQLSAALSRLDSALGVAIAHVPAPVAQHLTEARRNVEIERVQLVTTRSVGDYLKHWNLLTAAIAFSDADELIGTACNVTLAPLPL